MLSDKLPERFGQFRPLEILGQGGMGVVYLAEHVHSKTKVALKTVKLPKASLLQSIRREIYCLGRLQHPNIVKMVDSGVARGRPWYAMELLEGIMLNHHIQSVYRNAHFQKKEGEIDNQEKGAWPTEKINLITETMVAESDKNGTMKVVSTDYHRVSREEEREENGPSVYQSISAAYIESVCHLIYQLCDPLIEMHGQGMVHLDLKPDNIIIVPLNRPIIIDFGLLIRQGDETRREKLSSYCGSGAGTVAYMSPEQIKGDIIDARSDLYSLGCIFYELLVGKPPFWGTMPQVLMNHVKSAPVKPATLLPEISEDLSDLVLALLLKDPGDRIGYAATLKSQLRVMGYGSNDSSGDKPPQQYLYRPRFAGRQRELQKLDQLIESLQSANGGICAIEGSSGVGKTRLGVEFLKRAIGQKISVFEGIAHQDVKRPLGCFLGILQKLGDYCQEYGEAETRNLFGESGKILAKYEPSLKELSGFSTFSEPGVLSSEASITELFLALSQTFVKFSSKTPLIILVDDVQWADELTLGFIEFCDKMNVFENEKLFLVILYRTEEKSEKLYFIINSSKILKLVLGPLNAKHVTKIAKDVLSMAEIPEHFRKLLIKHAEGNPFYVSEYILAAVDHALLQQDSQGRWHADKLLEYKERMHVLPLPESLVERVTKRLNSFSDTATNIVEYAAILGREFTYEILFPLVDLDDGEFFSEIQYLLNGQILEEDSQGNLKFQHDIIREVAYTSISEQKKRMYHEKAAMLLEKIYNEESRYSSAQVAYHFEQAGNLTASAPYYLIAARETLHQFAMSESEQFFRKYLTFQQEENDEYAKTCLEFAHDILIHQAKYDEAHSLINKAQLIVNESKSEILQTHVNSINGKLLFIEGKHEQAIKLFEKNLAVCRRLGDKIEEAMCYKNLAVLYFMMDSYTRATHSCEKALHIFREAGELRDQAATISILGNIEAEQGNYKVAIYHYKRAIELHQETGNVMNEGNDSGNLALALMKSGEIEDARNLLYKALAIHRATKNRQFEGWTLARIAEIERLCFGNYEKAIAFAREAVTACFDTGAPFDMFNAMAQLIMAKLSCNQAAEKEIAELEEYMHNLFHSIQQKIAPSHRILKKVARIVKTGGHPNIFRGEFIDKIEPEIRQWLKKTGQLA